MLGPPASKWEDEDLDPGDLTSKSEPFLDRCDTQLLISALSQSASHRASNRSSWGSCSLASESLP